MQDAWLGRLFVRFRDQRDGKALAAVFDATARELIGVAAHLVPTADQAEDVVQSTFQRAIEQAGRFDAGRSLKGWLYGILWREAAKLTRQERRAPAPGALAPRSPGSPAEEAAQRELPDSVRLALARLPSPYREVLEPALLEERSAREIAAHLGRSPGTVRVQLQRGLERLRRELSAAQRELAARRAFGLLGLARLRARVLEHAGLASAAVPAASVAFLLAQLASVALPPVVWAGLAVLGAAAGIGVARSTDDAAEGAPAEALAGEVVLGSQLAPPPSAREAAPPLAGAAGPTTDSRPPREARAGQRRRPEPVAEPQVTGVVLDEARRPLAEVTVLAEAENHYGYAETFTDEHGRFAFGELAAGRWYFHADDERYARMWWQTHPVAIAEERSEPPAELELVVRTRHDVRGMVVDPAGMPVAGATVTLALEWPAGAEEPLQGRLTQELGSATADEQGAFTLERLGAGAWTARLDHPEFARTLVRFEVPGDPPRLEIDGGMALDGVVLAGGAPLSGVRVQARSTRQSHLTMGDWDVTTDDAGGFRFERIAPVGESRLHGVPTVTVTVYDPAWRSDHHRVYESGAGSLPRVTIEACARGEREPEALDVGRDWEGEARRAGKPFGSGVIEVRLAGDPADEEHLRIRGLSPELQRYSEQGRLAAGRPHRFERLAPGRYRVWTQNEGETNYAPATVELGPGEAAEIVLEPGELELSGAITCTGRPLASGRISARSIRHGSGQQASGRIEAGRYAITGLLPGSYELLVQDDGALTQHFEALVEDGATTLDLELPAGRIEGRLAFERSEESADFRVMVFPFGWYQESGNRGVFVDPDAGGRFAVRHLPPGDYVVSAWRATRHVPARVVTVSSAAPLQEVVLARSDELGVLAGAIANAGAGRLSIAALAHEPPGLLRRAYCEVDALGRFREGVDPGRYDLLVSSFDAKAPFVLVPDVVVEAGATTELALTLPAARTVSIALDAGEAWTPRAVWSLRMPNGAWLPYVLFVGSEAEGRGTGPRPFQLPHGTYSVAADFGDPGPVVREFTVVPGEGVQEILVTRP